ncbi:MAG: hypothetical protein H7178_05775 [Chitinophagaceae bacterium]|nr:hypothetical protein [Chitinophagaceae bacterium]
MKTIKLFIQEADYDSLDLASDELSFDDLKRKILLQSIKLKREQLEIINKKYGFDKLIEEEILNAVNEAKAEYRLSKK